MHPWESIGAIFCVVALNIFVQIVTLSVTFNELHYHIVFE